MQSNQLVKNWNLLLEGDKQGLYECFNIFYDDLYRFGLSLYNDQELIKDSIQSLFIELWEIKDKLADVKNIKQYIFTIFKRIIYKINQKFNRKNLDLDTLLEEISDDLIVQSSYESILIANQTDELKCNQLQEALSGLSPRQKEIIQFRYFDGKSYQEIAEITNLTERTIYNTLHNAIKYLRESPYFTVNKY